MGLIFSRSFTLLTYCEIPAAEKNSPKWQMWQDMKDLKAKLDALPPKDDAQLIIDTAQQEGLF